MSRSSLLVVTLAAMALVGTLAALFAPPAIPATKPATAHPSRHDIERRIDAAGSLRPTAIVHVGALVSGVVVSTAAEAGDRVRAGQLIATIDESPYRLQLDRARAMNRVAQRRADAARSALGRQQDLRRAGFVSDAAVEGAEDVAREADEDVRAANADVEAARINLAHCRIESPISGTVLSKEVAAGQSVASAFQVPDLFTIVSRLDRLEIVAMFAEADLGQIRAGMSVALHVPAFPELAFTATIERVLDTPETRQGIVDFPVLLSLPNEHGVLRPGMTAYIDMRVVARANALTVPNQAVSFARAQDRLERGVAATAPRGERHVYVLRGGVAQPVAVKLGAADDVRTEIIPVGALDERDDVLLSSTK